MLRVLAAAFMAVLAACAAHAQDGPRLALLIGNEDYPAEVGALSQPHQDVAALQAALVAAGFTVTPVLDADQASMNEAVLAFSRQLNAAGPDAVGFFYFAGHGASASVAGRRQNFLMPARARITDAQSAQLFGVELDRVINALGATQARAVFVVSDACRNTLQWSDVRGERGFAPVSRRPGMFIALSTSEDATAPDDGLFAAALARQLSQPGLTAERVFTLTFREVFTARGDNRLPTAVGALREDFCFISCPGETPAQPVEPPSFSAADPAQALWEAVSGSSDPADFQVIIDAYPESPFAALAANRIRALEAAQAPPEPVIVPAAQIREAQRLLAYMGYEPGPADGQAGSRTLAAVRAFRDALDLSPGDAIDDELLTDLRSARRLNHRAPTPRVTEVATAPAPTPLVTEAATEPTASGSSSSTSRAPGTVFRDRLSSGGRGPEMVVIPAGSFTMGSPASEEGRQDDEGPQRTVRITQPFAVGRFEVTFEEWAACVSGGGCSSRPNPSDEGWGRGRRPVINVNWDDAQAYVRWLSQQTGETYRLLSEAEWEYAARAGTTTRYAFGDSISGSQARFSSGSTVEVGSYRPNAFGLYDMHGNVWEWTQDCWNGSYSGAPTDGRAWESGDCSRRVPRGGSRGYSAQNLRSANRSGNRRTSRSGSFGFRLARTISP